MKWISCVRCGLSRHFRISNTWFKFTLLFFVWISYNRSCWFYEDSPVTFFLSTSYKAMGASFHDNSLRLVKSQFFIESANRNIKRNSTEKMVSMGTSNFNRHLKNRRRSWYHLFHFQPLKSQVEDNASTDITPQVGYFPLKIDLQEFLHRHRKKSEHVKPFIVDVSGVPKERVELEEELLAVKVVNRKDQTVSTELSWELVLKVLSDFDNTVKFVERNLTSTITDGKTTFIKLKFISPTWSLRIRRTVRNSERSETDMGVIPWTSGFISVSTRKTVLKPTSISSPYNSHENVILSPGIGFIIYDDITGQPADERLFAKDAWEARMSMLHDDVYQGNLSGTTTLTMKKSQVIFSNVTITGWGYSYVLRITVRSLSTPHRNLHCLIGPFDVDMTLYSELPAIEPLEYRTVSIAFDGEFTEVEKNPQKFNIFFLNKFGIKYSKVKWRNVTTSEGSVIVNAVIMGTAANLEETTASLANDILEGKADIDYLDSKKWKASLVKVPTRKLLQQADGGQTQNKDDSSKDEEGLPVAWIAAIVINAVLVVLFILAVIFCYCRSRNKRRDSMEGTIDQNFRGEPEMLFVNKAVNNGTEKTALIRSEQPTVFTVEEERRKLAEDDDEVDQFSHAESRARCTCVSPECYCSVGDYHKEEELKSLERQDQQMEEEISHRSYHSPTPEPVKHMPSPEPEPEPEDDDEFWRADSARYRSASRDTYEEPHQEEEDYEETYLPGTVVDQPEPVRDRRYLVYRVMDDDGSREFIGNVTLPEGGTSWTLHDLRRHLEDSEISSTIRNRPFRLMTEGLKEIPPEKMTSTVDSTYPSEAINIKYGKRFRPPVLQKPRPPVYLGPLGICSAPDCFKPSRLKCLDCGNVAYCGTRCLKRDLLAHKKVCFKPAWRV